MANFYASYPAFVANFSGSLVVSGTVTANQGTPNTAANGWPVKLTDGTSVTGVTAASTAAVATQPAAVVAFSPNSPLPTGSNTVGAVTQASGPWTMNLTEVGGAAIALGQTTMAASLPVTIASNQSAVPVSGTLAVTQSTSPWIVAGGGTAGSASTGVVSIQGIASMTPVQVSQATAANLNATVVGAGTAGTANAGVVTVQGIASMTPLLVTSSSSTTTGTFQDGSIAGASLTTSFATVVTAGGVLKHVDMRNNTNGIVVVSLNSGSGTAYTLDPGDAVSLDLAINGSSIATSTTLQAKYSGSAPTTGNIRINSFY